MKNVKPYKGEISNWKIRPCKGGLGYFVTGRFMTHPNFACLPGHTSYVVKHNKETGEIETRNSRYRLVQALS